jgi:hypothetical protein
VETANKVNINESSELEKLEYRCMLYDFYGELMTPHQKKIYEDAVFNDYSLSEIADENGISRQGVHDLIKRCDKLLNGYEEKLHLVEKFSKIKDKIQQINMLTDDDEIKQLSNEIIEEL